MASDLTSVLGVLIAFATVMLLFSIVVTSLVQATIALTRLRSRNLWHGLTRVLMEVDAGDAESDKAFSVMKQCSSGLVAALKNNQLPSWANTTLGPQVSWLTLPQLEEACFKQDIDPAKVNQIVRKFSEGEAALSKRFHYWTRVMSIVWAAAVVGYFQLSTPDILNHLSSTPQLRAELQQLGRQTVEADTEPAVTKGQSAKGTANKTVSESDVELAEVPSSQPMVSKASSLYFFERGRDKDFLSGPSVLGDVIGMVMTTLLLTLGAPFWFNLLKNTVNFNDKLVKNTSTEETSQTRPDKIDQQLTKLEKQLSISVDAVEKVELQNQLDDLRLTKARLGGT